MTTFDSRDILTVSQLTRTIRNTLELHFRFIHLRGEISNLRIPYSGHMYFTLKDSNAQIRAVLFKGQQKFLQAPLKEGQSVICHGRLSVYELRGEYQIIVDTIDFSGTGDLRLQFERLKKSLAEEGLFAAERKKTIPLYPDHVVLITSATGAAVRDYLKIAAKRRYWGKISILPVAVQGRGAAAEIAQALETACRQTDGDLIVLIRGGGSLEDLWAFNEEKTARAIAAATVPVVTGIGHDTDLTIADLCADLSTHTPTAAAEATLADNAALCETFRSRRKNLIDFLRRKIDGATEKIATLRRIIGNLDLYLANHQLRLDSQTTALATLMESRIANERTRLDHRVQRLRRQSPVIRVSLQRQKAAYLRAELEKSMMLLLRTKREQLGRQAALLDSVSPLAVLSRGYAIVSTERTSTAAGKIVTDSEQVDIDQKLNLRLHRGELRCTVTGKELSGPSIRPGEPER